MTIGPLANRIHTESQRQEAEVEDPERRYVLLRCSKKSEAAFAASMIVRSKWRAVELAAYRTSTIRVSPEACTVFRFAALVVGLKTGYFARQDPNIAPL